MDFIEIQFLIRVHPRFNHFFAKHLTVGQKPHGLSETRSAPRISFIRAIRDIRG
jgi:hypothetical protein